jgi:hypothetical protein
MTDERKAFEAAWSSLDWGEVYLATSENGNQLDDDKIAAWLIWQARAALSAPPREPTEAMTAMAMELRKHAKWISEDGRPLNSATPLIRAASLLESLAAPAIPAPSAPAREDEQTLREMARDFVKGGGPQPHNVDALVGRAYALAIERNRAPATGVVEALRLAQHALRAPQDDWKGELERTALDAINAALAGQDKGTL